MGSRAAKDLGINVAEMQLRFTTDVPADYWIGSKIYTPTFGNLPDAVCVWKLMSAARGCALRGNAINLLLRVDQDTLRQSLATLLEEFLKVWQEYGMKDVEAERDRLQNMYRSREPNRER